MVTNGGQNYNPPGTLNPGSPENSDVAGAANLGENANSTPTAAEEGGFAGTDEGE